MAYKNIARAFVFLVIGIASTTSYADNFWLNHEFVGRDTISQQTCKIKTPEKIEKSFWGDSIEIWLTIGDSAPRKFKMLHTPFSSHSQFYREIIKKADYKISSDIRIQDVSDRYLLTLLVQDKEQSVSLNMRYTISSINGFDVEIQNADSRLINCVDMK